MKQALQFGSWAIGLWLNVLVISAMTRGGYRRYPFVFAYSLALFASTAIEIVVQLAAKSYYDLYYWYDEVILDVLVFCLVIALIDQAARSSPRKILERHWLILGAALIAAVSIAVHHPPRFNLRMTLVSRDLNICAVILDLILWSLLLTARRPDRQLLLLSGGLGIQLTGAIMGEQLLSVSRHMYFAGTLLQVATSVLGLYIWWRALRTLPETQHSPYAAHE